MIDGMVANPCHGVRRNKESARDRYVGDEEYQCALEQATPPYLPLFMELAYLLYARACEILELTRAELRPDGVYMQRRKGSSDNIVKWSPRLEQAVNAALGLPSKIASIYLLHDRYGQPLKYNAVRNAWDRTMARYAKDAEKAGRVWTPFTRHDLKAKGISDVEVKQNSAGHKSAEMQARYNRKPEQVEPPR